MEIMSISETILAPKILTLEANQVSLELDVLRKHLKQLNCWPAAGDEFLALIPRTDNAEPLSEKENEWLHQVVDACMEGTDIGFRYPAFFQKLLVNSTLRQAFLEELASKTKPNDLI